MLTPDHNDAVPCLASLSMSFFGLLKHLHPVADALTILGLKSEFLQEGFSVFSCLAHDVD